MWRLSRRLRWYLVWGAAVLLYSLVQGATESPPPPVRDEPPTLLTPRSTVTTTTTPREEGRRAEGSTTTTGSPGGVTEAEGPWSTTPGPGRPEGTVPSTPRNCTPPAIEQFPKPLIGPSARKHGALLIHVLVCIYSFIGLAIVCDDYFVVSLDRICEVLRLTPDVAGATFMAAGSSAPELATVVIGVFFAKDDIGVSGVIGSAVFNIMFVIAICAIFGGTVSYLNWWPLCRDSLFYLISILIMLAVIFDEVITWGESLFMLIVYVIYCVCLTFNAALEQWAQTLPVPCKVVQEENEDQNLVSYKTLEAGAEGYAATQQVEQAAPPQQQQPSVPAWNPTRAWDDPNQAWGDKPAQTWDKPAAQSWDNPAQSWDNPVPNGGGGAQPTDKPPAPPAPQAPVHPPKPEYYKAREQTNQVSPLIKPETNDQMTLIQWHLCYPIHYTAQKTMPNCKTDQYKNWYPFTFAISMIWISFYSYIMVWMITVIGSTLGIPDTVMGLTFVAAGVSVPDALSSLAVVKEGYGDMAVSNAVGSNVFDILICLGLPWFMKTAVIKPGTTVRVYSKGLTYSTLTLLSTVVFLISVTHWNGWKMDKRYGIILLAWYLIFICFACLYELNVFGDWNQPECESDY